MDKAIVIEYITFVLIIFAIAGLNEMSISLLGPYGTILPIACVLIPVLRHKLKNKRFL